MAKSNKLIFFKRGKTFLRRTPSLHHEVETKARQQKIDEHNRHAFNHLCNEIMCSLLQYEINVIDRTA